MASLHVFVLMCAGALFMASVVESRHPLRLSKRQTTGQETDHCLAEFVEVTCTSGSVQDLLDLTQRCNFSTASVAGVCGRNANGMLCGAYNPDTIRENAESIGCDFSNTTCTPECRTRLMSIRDELDCCFSFFNDSSNGLFDSILFNSNLWTSCGVEGYTQMCSNNTLRLNKIPADPITCTPTFFLNKVFFNINCRREYIEPLIARLSAVEGCEDYVTEDDFDSCNTNRFGTHCDDIISETSGHFTVANLNCNSSCDPLCIETLNNISMTSGCCFNERYNNTNTGDDPDWLSHEFYSRCGLESPGLCPLGISIPDDEDPMNTDPTKTPMNTDLTNTDPTSIDPISTASGIIASSISMTIIALLTYTLF